MASYAVITKVIIHSKVSADADSVAGSYAKEVSDYIESIDSTSQAIISMHSVELASSGAVMTVIVHPS